MSKNLMDRSPTKLQRIERQTNEQAWLFLWASLSKDGNTKLKYFDPHIQCSANKKISIH